MKKSVLFLLFVFMMMQSVLAQTDPKTYQIYLGNGQTSDLKQIITQIDNYDVVFLGESHDDSVAHKLQLEIFKKAVKNYGKEKNILLSLEMFSRDVQIVIDEYRNNLISEKHFLDSSRPWGNYKTDYRPLVEFAKDNNLKIVAANAPRRYVNMVSRLGRESLEKLSPQAYQYLSPMPLGYSSKIYTEKFYKLLGGHGSENIMDSQTLWDSTMAFSIFEQLKNKQKNLVIHLNGSFHTANRLGTVEQLLKLKPDAKILVISMNYEENFKSFDKTKYTDWGDFVILTDAKQPRSIR